MAIDFSAWEGYRVIWLRVGSGRSETEGGPTWLEAIERHCRAEGQKLAWVSLQDGDNDPQQFVQAVNGSVNQALGLPAGFTGQLEPEETPQAWINLINRISELESPLILALESYDRVEHPGVHELVTELLEYQPQALQVLLFCQTVPPLPLPRLRTRRFLWEVAPMVDN